MPHFDYSSPGAYFITIVTANRTALFGEIVDSNVSHSSFGLVAVALWQRLPTLFDFVELDEWVLMPNHLHAVLWITGSAPATESGLAPRDALLKPHSLGAVVGNFKSVSARRINQMRKTAGGAVWQTNFYERVIRNDREMLAVREYIAGNPAKWAEDTENPTRRPAL